MTMFNIFNERQKAMELQADAEERIGRSDIN